MLGRTTPWLYVLATVLGWARLASAQSVPLPQRPFVPWREGTHLRWQDFQAPRCPQDVGSVLVRAGACSATVLELLPEVNSEGRNSYWVASYFVKANSWVRDTTVWDSALMLEHEQLHFDLNELIARKMRQRIAQYERADRDIYGAALHAEMAGLFAERTQLNTRFDLEAYNDVTAGTVRKWQRWLRQELAGLDAYKAKAISVASVEAP